MYPFLQLKGDKYIGVHNQEIAGVQIVLVKVYQRS